MSEEADKPASENSPDGADDAAPNLESMLGGLDFTPDWAKKEPGVTSESRQSDNRGRGGRGGPRAPKGSSRRNLQGVRVKPRRDGPPRGGRSGGGDNRSSYGGGGHRDRSRGPRPPRAPRVPVHVDFIPEKKRLSKVVKVIRGSHRVFPLRVVAEKFMENPAFISMKYTVKERDEAAKDFFLYVCRANGMTFTDEQACIQYVIEHGLEANYEAEERKVDPPAGNFVCVGRHRPSGKLIGPPNWHGYQTRLIELHKELAPDMPYEHFQGDLEMVHEEEAINAWKEAVSTQRFYREKLEEPAKEEPAKEEPAKENPAGDKQPEAPVEAAEETSGTGETTEAAPAEPETGEATPETTPENSGEGEAVAGDHSDEEISDGEEAAPAAEAAGEPEKAAEEEAPEPEVDDRPFNLTRDQAEKVFRENYLSKLVGRTRRQIQPGYLFDTMTDPSLLSLTQYHLRRETDRPNSIIFALRPAFKHMRLHVFRYDGELMVSGIPQHPLPADQKVTPEIQSIVDYVAEHPGCGTQEALKAVSNSVDEIPAETVSHFRWLIEKGHVLEFHDDTLHLPHAPSGGGGKKSKKKAPEPKPEEKSEEKPEAKADTQTSEMTEKAPEAPAPEVSDPEAPAPASDASPEATPSEPPAPSEGEEPPTESKGDA